MIPELERLAQLSPAERIHAFGLVRQHRDQSRYKVSQLIKQLEKHPYEKFTVHLGSYAFRKSHRYNWKELPRLRKIHEEIMLDLAELNNEIDMAKMEQML